MSKQESATESALILALQRKCEYQAEQLEIARILCGKYSICANCDGFIRDAFIPENDEWQTIEDLAYYMSCTFCYDRYMWQSDGPRICYCEECRAHCLKSPCPHRKVCDEHLLESEINDPCDLCSEE